MSFSNLTVPAKNGTSFTSTLKSLVSSGDDGSLNNFDTAASWNGDSTPTPNIPNHLVFDGSNDSISLGTSLNAQTDIVFTTWLRPDNTDRDEVIFSYGDSNFHGLTLTTNRLVLADMCVH